MTQNAIDFLSTLLCLTSCNEREEEEPQSEHDVRDCTIHDFHPDFVKAVEDFCLGFRNFLAARGFDLDRLSELERSFGSNVYFSQSGHGCGFWDESSELGEQLDRQLEWFCRSDLRFQELEHMLWLEDGTIHLAIVNELRDKYLKEYFDYQPLP